MKDLKNKWQDKLDHYKQLKAITLKKFDNDTTLSPKEELRLKGRLESYDSSIHLCREILTDLSK